ncbi:unnamed protein product [Paramecium octaurelia]|uniref:Uncharacterized protein n=1 Tax=Paramecium octaurelia TaxID=43137 RepID=A0A8S1YJQ0_PAROT|nr:unnamed protein product [Paramecium octaurelia]
MEMGYNSSYGTIKNTTDREDAVDPISKLVQNNNQAQIRIYSLGIGKGCSQNLIKRVAEVGNGKCYIVCNKEDIHEKVIDLLEDSLTPYLQAFKLESNLFNVASIVPFQNQLFVQRKMKNLQSKSFSYRVRIRKSRVQDHLF